MQNFPANRRPSGRRPSDRRPSEIPSRRPSIDPSRLIPMDKYVFISLHPNAPLAFWGPPALYLVTRCSI